MKKFEQPFGQFGGNALAFAEVDQPVEAAIHQEDGDKRIEVQHGVFATQHAVDAFFDVVAVD